MQELFLALMKGDVGRVKSWAGNHPQYYGPLRNTYGRLLNLRRLSLLDRAMSVL